MPKGFCGRCFDAGIPSLCHHKSLAHSAALGIFDNRAGRSPCHAALIDDHQMQQLKRCALQASTWSPALGCSIDPYILRYVLPGAITYFAATLDSHCPFGTRGTDATACSTSRVSHRPVRISHRWRSVAVQKLATLVWCVRLYRHMSGAVYEEEHLGNFPHAVHCTGMPCPPPLRMAKHQVRCIRVCPALNCLLVTRRCARLDVVT